MQATKEQLIAIQKEQLKFWELILKPDVYSHLEKYVTKDNDEITEEFRHKIVRGDAIYEAVSNIFSVEKLLHLKGYCYDELLLKRGTYNYTNTNDGDWNDYNKARLEYEIAMREKYSTLPTKD